MVFELAREHFAVPVQNVVRLLKYDRSGVSRPFGDGGEVDGFLPQKGGIVPVLDLRQLLGMTSMEKETESVLETLRAREQDHINWLDELESSVREEREFRLTTDHHACKFGKWYDALRADSSAMSYFTNGNGTLLALMQAFDSPHQRIHALGVEVRRLISEHRRDEAVAVIDHSRNTDLHLMLNLFARAQSLIASLRRTLLLVLEHERSSIGVLIDQVLGLRSISPEQVQDVSVRSSMIRRMALTSANQKPISLLDVSMLYDRARSRAA